MSAKSARREYLEALAAFERACRDFSKGMGAVLDPAQPKSSSEPQPLLANLGPRKPAKRALRSDSAEQVKRAR
ncbi:hypothetical protein QTH97_31685 [Variovorax sp. J22R24]|uniref:hypothetical protein n=1 Tax=Variovorax gracilis TaxID=3053502 RepID=UPI002574DC49|nr:hypothetical protein [Variovorax sp. J22R24]MDM0109525.1 hypothetical protein [Variovorax sp. J22R24]